MGVCLFLSFLLFRTRYVRYLITLWWIFLVRVLMVGFSIFILISLLMQCSCMAPLTLAMMIIRGLIFHPVFCMVLIKGSDLVCLCLRAWSGYMSWNTHTPYTFANRARKNIFLLRRYIAGFFGHTDSLPFFAPSRLPEASLFMVFSATTQDPFLASNYDGFVALLAFNQEPAMQGFPST